MAKAFDRTKLILIAAAEEGYLEKETNSQLDNKTANAGNKNRTKYARDLYSAGYYNGNKQGVAWCDIFVDWCFYKAFGKADGQALQCQTGDLGASCTYSAKYYKNKGQFYTKNPQVGDQIFFKDSSGDFCHTGLVYKVDSSKVYTIEGNTSSASGVVANGGGVFKKSYALTYNKIAGYGRPKYNDDYGKPVNKPTTANNATAKPETSTKPKTVKATESAKKYDKALTGTYKVSWSNINVRNGAGSTKKLLVNIPKGTKVQCYGYYTTVNLVKWLYVQFTYKNVTYTGFICKNGLTK